MNTKIIAAVAALSLTLAACSQTVSPTPPVTNGPPPTQPGNPTVNNACAIFNTLQWAIPLVEQLSGTHKLSAQAQAALADAQAVVAAGCQAGDATLMVRAGAAAQALVQILWGPTATVPAAPPPPPPAPMRKPVH
jgi:hypothetical protein